MASMFSLCSWQKLRMEAYEPIEWEVSRRRPGCSSCDERLVVAPENISIMAVIDRYCNSMVGLPGQAKLINYFD